MSRSQLIRRALAEFDATYRSRENNTPTSMDVLGCAYRTTAAGIRRHEE